MILIFLLCAKNSYLVKVFGLAHKLKQRLLEVTSAKAYEMVYGLPIVLVSDHLALARGWVHS